jgi:hypothetical protein
LVLIEQVKVERLEGEFFGGRDGHDGHAPKRVKKREAACSIGLLQL